MDFRRFALVLGSTMALACGPSGAAADTDTDTDTDTEGTGTGSGPSTSTNPTGATGSMSGTTTTNETGDPDPSLASSSSGAPPDTTTGDCPPGSEGCLCDVGAQCDDGLECDLDSGTCLAPADCDPIDTEPHEDEDSATDMDTLTCGDSNVVDVVGTVQGPEADWYTFPGDSSFMCSEQPAAIVSAEMAVDVCVFVECSNGSDFDAISCGQGSSDTSPDGREGCCGVDQASVEAYDCAGFGGQDVEVFISVGSEEAVCVDYTLEYSF